MSRLKPESHLARAEPAAENRSLSSPVFVECSAISCLGHTGVRVIMPLASRVKKVFDQGGAGIGFNVYVAQPGNASAIDRVISWITVFLLNGQSNNTLAIASLTLAPRNLAHETARDGGAGDERKAAEVGLHYRALFLTFQFRSKGSLSCCLPLIGRLVRCSAVLAFSSCSSEFLWATGRKIIHAVKTGLHKRDAIEFLAAALLFQVRYSASCQFLRVDSSW